MGAIISDVQSNCFYLLTGLLGALTLLHSRAAVRRFPVGKCRLQCGIFIKHETQLLCQTVKVTVNVSWNVTAAASGKFIHWSSSHCCW